MRSKNHFQLALFSLFAISLLNGLAILVASAQSAQGIEYAVRLNPSEPGMVQVYVDARHMTINKRINTATLVVAFYDAGNHLIKKQSFNFLSDNSKLTRTEHWKSFKHTYANARSAGPLGFLVEGYGGGGGGKWEGVPDILAAGKVSEWPVEKINAVALADFDLEMSYYISSVSSGKLMDVKDSSEEDWAPIIQTSRQEGSPQRWRFEALHGADEGYYLVRSARSNKCLDVRLGATDDGVAIIQYTCAGGDGQKWAIIPIADSAFQLVAKHSGKALDVKGAVLEDVALIQQTRHQGTNQQWRLTPER
jgi:hypothetical protein